MIDMDALTTIEEGFPKKPQQPPNMKKMYRNFKIQFQKFLNDKKTKPKTTNIILVFIY